MVAERNNQRPNWKLWKTKPKVSAEKFHKKTASS